MHLKELKKKTPAELVEMAEELEVEAASTMRRQDLMFAILKELAEDGEEIIGQGTIEVLADGFGFLRSPEANYLAGPDDIYVSPNQVRKWGLRTGDTVEGEVRAPKDRERYFAITKLISINFDRYHFTPGQGPARTDRRPAAHRQDRAAAEHCQGHYRQSSGSVPAGAAGR